MEGWRCRRDKKNLEAGWVTLQLIFMRIILTSLPGRRRMVDVAPTWRTAVTTACSVAAQVVILVRSKSLC